MRTFGVVVFGVSLSGCVSLLSHYTLSDEQVIGGAGALAQAHVCAEKGYSRVESVYALGYAMEQFHSVAAYNQQLFEETFQAKKKEAEQIPNHQLLSQCAEINRDLGMVTQKIYSNYLSMAAQRRNDAAAMMASSPSNYNYSQPVNSYSPPQVPNFSSRISNGSRHYLIQTDSGMKQCTVVGSSGFVTCN